MEKTRKWILYTLAWKIPWTEEPGRLQSMGSLSWTQLSDFTFTSLSCIGEGNGNPLQYFSLGNSMDGGPWPATVCGVTKESDTEGGNRQNRLCLESRTPSWAGLWTLSSMPNFYANDIPTGKPGPRKEEPQGLYRDSPGLKE